MQLTLRQPDYGHTTNTGASRRPEAQSSTLRQSVRREHTPAKAHAHVHVTRSSQPEHGARRHRNPGHRLAAAAAANSPSAGGAAPCATLCTGPDSIHQPAWVAALPGARHPWPQPSRIDGRLASRRGRGRRRPQASLSPHASQRQQGLAQAAITVPSSQCRHSSSPAIEHA